MRAEPGTIQAEDLLAHLGWARSLARVLVREPSDADDLVQTTLAATLSRPPQEDRPVRPWMARVMRNLARERVRSARRREAREQDRVPPAEATPSAGELAARIELQRLLADLLLGLPEAVRSTLVLRYYEDLSSAEIARRTGTPAGTVRWRLKRGLDELRERLDDRHDGDRRAWIAALTPLLSPEDAALGAGAGGSVTFTGALTMILTHKLFLFAASLSVVFLGLRSMRSIVPGQEPPPATAGISRDPMVDASEETAEALPVASTAQDGTARMPVRPAPASITLPIGGPMTRVQVRFVDSAGGPVAGVRVEVSVDGMSGATLRSGSSLDAAYPFARLLDPSMFETESDSSGAVFLESNLLDRPRSITLCAEAPDLSFWSITQTVEPGAQVDLGDVALDPAGAISGKVVDHDGLPIAGASVSVDDVDLRRSPRGPSPGAGPNQEVLSDASGAFRCPGVSVGDHRVWVRFESRRSSSDVVDVRVGEEVEGVIVVVGGAAEAGTVRVRVLSSDGEPATAFLRARTEDGQTLGGLTDAEGRSILGGQPPVARIEELLATDPKGRLGYALARDVLPGPDELTLTLGGATEVELEVVDDAGEPVEDYRAELHVADFGSGFRMAYSHAQGHHPGGRATLGATDRRARIEITAAGYAVALSEPFEPVESATHGPVRVELERVAGVSGRVLAGGAPVEGAWVAMHPAPEPGELVSRNGFPARMGTRSEAGARTDSGGRFRLDIREAGRFVLRAGLDGWPDVLGPEIELDPARDVDGVELGLLRGGRLEGTYVLSDGSRPAGAVIGITRGAMDARTTRTDREGRFIFENLAPGPWFVTRRQRDMPELDYTQSMTHASYAWEHPFNCEIVSGETTPFTLTGPAPARNRIHGRFALGTVPLSEWEVSLEAATFGDPLDDRDTLLLGRMDAAGAFEIEADVPPGAYLLSFQDRRSGAGLDVTKEIVLDGTDQRVDVELAVGTLTGVLPTVIEKPFCYVWEGPDGLRAIDRIEPTESHGFELRVPAGTGRIAHYGWVEAQVPSDWPLVQEVQIGSQETVFVDLR